MSIIDRYNLQSIGVKNKIRLKTHLSITTLYFKTIMSVFIILCAYTTKPEINLEKFIYKKKTLINTSLIFHFDSFPHFRNWNGEN